MSDDGRRVEVVVGREEDDSEFKAEVEEDEEGKLEDKPALVLPPPAVVDPDEVG